MKLKREMVESALAGGDRSEIEAVFECLVLGDAVMLDDGGLMAEAERRALFEVAADLLSVNERPVPRTVAAVLHDFAPERLNADPTFATAAAIARENAARLPTGNRRRRDRGDLIAEIIAEEGVDSPRLRQIGQTQGGAGSGEAFDGAPGRGAHVPGGGEGENPSEGAGSFDDPDAPPARG